MGNEVRLIDANALRRKMADILRRYDTPETFEEKLAVYSAFDEVVSSPTIDPEILRPKGRWEECDWVEFDGHDECVHYPHEGRVCTNCRNAFKADFVCDLRVEYCPHCGAKMEVAE